MLVNESSILFTNSTVIRLIRRFFVIYLEGLIIISILPVPVVQMDVVMTTSNRRLTFDPSATDHKVPAGCEKKDDMRVSLCSI